MKINYIVNYGVDNRHIFESKPFTLYRDAKRFYKSLDWEKWGAGNITKLEDGDGGPFGPAKITIKENYYIR